MTPEEYKKLSFQQKFTFKKSRDFLGVCANACLIYNCDTKMWNRNDLMGYDVEPKFIRSARMNDVKSAFDNDPVFGEKYELVAIVIMPIDKKFFPGKAQLVKSPRYYIIGTALVGNIICRDKNTKELMPVSDYWIGVNQYENCKMASCMSTVDMGLMFAKKTERVQLMMPKSR